MFERKIARLPRRRSSSQTARPPPPRFPYGRCIAVALESLLLHPPFHPLFASAIAQQPPPLPPPLSLHQPHRIHGLQSPLSVASSTSSSALQSPTSSTHSAHGTAGQPLDEGVSANSAVASALSYRSALVAAAATLLGPASSTTVVDESIAAVACTSLQQLAVQLRALEAMTQSAAAALPPVGDGGSPRRTDGIDPKSLLTGINSRLNEIDLKVRVFFLFIVYVLCFQLTFVIELLANRSGPQALENAAQALNNATQQQHQQAAPPPTSSSGFVPNRTAAELPVHQPPFNAAMVAALNSLVQVSG